MTRTCLCPLLALSLLLGCGDKSADKKPEDAKQEQPAKQAEQGEVAKPAEPEQPAEVHFDISQDKSGVLARTAGVLETTEAIHDENLAAISHHADKLPSDEAVCKHIAEVRGEELDMIACVKEAEHHVVKLGPEIYAQAVTCLMDASTPAAVDVCIAAEKEAEILLHEKPHGDGLDQDTCDQLFAHFSKLAMADAGEQAEVVGEILQETRVDILAACVDQGTKAEAECALGAKSLAEIKGCASML